jgi:hypothetical protein
VSPLQGLARAAVHCSLNSSGSEPDRRQVGRLLRSLLSSLTDRKASIDRPKLSNLVVELSFRNSQAGRQVRLAPMLDEQRQAVHSGQRPISRNLGHNPPCRRFRVREWLDFETMPASCREAPRQTLKAVDIEQVAGAFTLFRCTNVASVPDCCRPWGHRLFLGFPCSRASDRPISTPLTSVA